MISSTWDGNINWLFHVRDSHSWVKALNHSDTSPISEFSPSLASPAQLSSARAKNGFDIPLMLCVVWYQIPSPHTPPRPLTCPDCWEMSRWIFLRGRQLIWYHTTHYTIHNTSMPNFSNHQDGFLKLYFIVRVWSSNLWCIMSFTVLCWNYCGVQTKIFEVSDKNIWWFCEWGPSILGTGHELNAFI